MRNATGPVPETGARCQCVIQTIVETCKLQDIAPFDFIRSALSPGGIEIAPLTRNDPSTSQSHPTPSPNNGTRPTRAVPRGLQPCKARLEPPA